MISLDMNYFFNLALGLPWTRILAQNLVRALALSSCFLASASAFGQQVIPMPPIQLQNFRATEAARDCDNSILAAALESVLSYDGVRVQQSYWIDKLFFGRNCSTARINYEKLASGINRDWVLDDGRKITLRARYLTGADVSADAVILQLNAKRPMIFVWKDRPYLIYGAAYDKVVNVSTDVSTGNIQYVIRKLDLIDATKKAEQGLLSFDRSKENSAEINGIMTLDVGFR